MGTGQDLGALAEPVFSSDVYALSLTALVRNDSRKRLKIASLQDVSGVHELGGPCGHQGFVSRSGVRPSVRRNETPEGHPPPRYAFLETHPEQCGIPRARVDCQLSDRREALGRANSECTRPKRGFSGTRRNRVSVYVAHISLLQCRGKGRELRAARWCAVRSEV